ncbi:hypothetical protein B9Q02_07300 [Candidatus Marsarchaeota G1 archaeon BE_D]|uniref:Uncharacterized protein n=1 Tax=Candidatus Marsarchaeota G1 archaeon BE_D TaxID=1978156 RepID=A0A2R6AFN8_9ARCH|nr:MAG: hypothetical protein B9Q02_07300 [Candidatus Marsarchaeota G1 archaeon BE_D]
MKLRKLALALTIAFFTLFHFCFYFANGETLFFLATIGSVGFWFSFLLLSMVSFLRRAFAFSLNALRSKGYALALLIGYFVIHVFVYGLLLERLLVSIFGSVQTYSGGLEAYFSANFNITPKDVLSEIYALTLNPSFVVFIPPLYGLALGPFAFYSALAIDFLVLSNIAVILRSTKTYKVIAFPVIGVVGGASCCLSVPELIVTLSSIGSQLVLLTPLETIVLNTLYYVLPISVMVALKLNLDTLVSVKPKVFTG